MAKGYVHVEIEAAQAPRKTGSPCGDVVEYERSISATTLVVSDGMGHGVKAHIAARMYVSRMLELLRQGISLRSAFTRIVTTLEEAKGTDQPYAVITVARISTDGVTTVLSYEMPPPIFVTRRYAQVLPQRKEAVGESLVGETNCHLEPGEGIVVLSDGITQAGLGRGLAHGWTADGASGYIRDCLNDGIAIRAIPTSALARARELWGETLGDDCTAVLASCRPGKIVNILTGPPRDTRSDKELVQRFMSMEGEKVVSGGATAQMVAKALGRELILQPGPQSMLAPPKYHIQGIDLVTEGAVTLNQVYNVLDEDPSAFDEESGVTNLHQMLRTADRVNILMGAALNPATKDISFRQKGILTRHAVVPLIAQKLRDAGKLVVVEQI